MFRPNKSCLWYRKAKKRSATGKETFLLPKIAKIGVVHLIEGAAKTQVRADSTASHGSADQKVTSAKILARLPFDFAVGDVLQIDGVLIEISSKERRYAVSGKLDHIEYDGVTRSQL